MLYPSKELLPAEFSWSKGFERRSFRLLNINQYKKLLKLVKRHWIGSIFDITKKFWSRAGKQNHTEREKVKELIQFGLVLLYKIVIYRESTDQYITWFQNSLENQTGWMINHSNMVAKAPKRKNIKNPSQNHHNK